MSEMDANRRFAELAGIEWHEIDVSNEPILRCSCGFTTRFPSELFDHCDSSNPDFIDAREVIKVMRSLPVKEYASFLNGGVGCYDSADPDVGICDACELISVHYLFDATGLLRDEAIKFLEDKR